jgi:hypothetical protein
MSELTSTLDTLASRLSQKFEKSSLDNMDAMSKVENWEKIRLQLAAHGTDIEKNRADLMGDGDQRPIKNSSYAQFHRDIWSAGADVQDLFLQGGLPPFIMACLIGSPEGCAKMLEECKDQAEKTKMLETRHSLLRLSPIFFAAIGFATIRAMMGGANDGASSVEVVRILLAHGARPDARDVCGKTIVHYCCGALCRPGTTTLLDIADLCINRAKELNLPKLVDTRDRFGEIPMMQAIMMTRVDLMEFLCTKHGADAHIKDYDGADPQKMAQFSPSIRAVMNSARNVASYEDFKARCLNCQGTSAATFRCSKCNVATYCSQDCQTAHWKASHKKECNSCEVSAEIIVTQQKSQAFMSTSGATAAWAGQPPTGSAVDALFDIKIQIGPTVDLPFLLYDKSRSLETTITASNCVKVKELFALIRSYTPCAGRKAYMRAKVNDKGELVILTSPLFVRKW